MTNHNTDSVNDTITPEMIPQCRFEGASKMTLAEYAFGMQTISGDERTAGVEAIKLAAHVLPLAKIDAMTAAGAEHLLTAVSWLHDTMYLVWESVMIREGRPTEYMGSPYHPGSMGPHIPMALVRDPDEAFPAEFLRDLVEIAKEAEVLV